MAIYQGCGSDRANRARDERRERNLAGAEQSPLEAELVVCADRLESRYRCAELTSWRASNRMRAGSSRSTTRCARAPRTSTQRATSSAARCSFRRPFATDSSPETMPPAPSALTVPAGRRSDRQLHRSRVCEGRVDRGAGRANNTIRSCRARHTRKRRGRSSTGARADSASS